MGSREGFPSVRKEDLRFYFDQDGHFTPQLAVHYEPRKPGPQEAHAVFVKAGSAWTEIPYSMLVPGMVVRVMERATKLFLTWQDTGATEIVVLAVARNREGVWGLRARKATAQEIQDA